MIQTHAVFPVPGAIQEVIVVCYEAHGQLPLPDQFSPVRVHVIPEVFVKTCGYVE